jgi:pilus assembly protein Flp/PilA
VSDGQSTPGLTWNTWRGTETAMLTGIVRRAIHFLKEEHGPTAVEYAVMLAMIILVCIVVIASIGSHANSNFGNVALQASVKTSSS